MKPLQHAKLFALSVLEALVIFALLALTLLGATALGQAPTTPRLHIVLGAENYPGLPGLTNIPPHNADSRGMTINNVGTNRLLVFNAEIVNLGSPWMAPFADTYFDSLTFTPAVRGFWYFSLTSRSSGAVVAEESHDARFMIWDAVPLAQGLPQYYGWWVPGISPGRAAIPAIHTIAGTWLDITRVPNGDYTLAVEVDPTNKWGQFERAEVPVRIENYNVEVR